MKTFEVMHFQACKIIQWGDDREWSLCIDYPVTQIQTASAFLNQNGSSSWQRCALLVSRGGFCMSGWAQCVWSDGGIPESCWWLKLTVKPRRGTSREGNNFSVAARSVEYIDYSFSHWVEKRVKCKEKVDKQTIMGRQESMCRQVKSLKKNSKWLSDLVPHGYALLEWNLIIFLLKYEMISWCLSCFQCQASGFRFIKITDNLFILHWIYLLNIRGCACQLQIISNTVLTPVMSEQFFKSRTESLCLYSPNLHLFM